MIRVFRPSLRAVTVAACLVVAGQPAVALPRAPESPQAPHGAFAADGLPARARAQIEALAAAKAARTPAQNKVDSLLTAAQQRSRSLPAAARAVRTGVPTPFSGRLIRSLVTAVSAVGLTLVPVGAASAASAPKAVGLGVKTHCTGFSVHKAKDTNTFATVFADSGAAYGTDTNRLVYQTIATAGDFSTGGSLVESKAIRVGRFFRDAHGRQHGRLLARKGLKVVSATLTYTVNGGRKNELHRTTKGTFLRSVRAGKKAFLAYDFVAPRKAHVDTFDLAAINPKARSSGSEPVVHRTRFRTTGKPFDFGPQELHLNLQSEVFRDHRCNLKARSFAISADGAETATNRFDVSATDTASSLLVSTTVHKPAKTLLTFCTSSNKKERDLTHAIVTRTSNGNHLVTCVAPRRNRFEGSSIYALDPSAVSSPSAFHSSIKAAMAARSLARNSTPQDATSGGGRRVRPPTSA